MKKSDKIKESGRGGKREGSGRKPPKYPTVPVAVRVPVALIAEVDRLCGGSTRTAVVIEALAEWVRRVQRLSRVQACVAVAALIEEVCE